MPEIQYYASEWEVSDALQAFYVPYASYVIQTRALPDARDGLKTGARYILYAQYKDKLTIKNKRRKAVATVNAAMRFSPHGDASILGTAVRLSQDFSLRYPIIEVQGNNGSYLAGDDYSQARYIEMRGNEIAYDMTYLLEKETIDKWKMNYTNEEEYPTVLPSKFPYALVNGSFGIGVACGSSIPPHNIKDVCNAAITLINNPNASFEEIYCPIDFPTGGTIINEDEVKESLKNGCGKAAIVRATIDYNEKENELIVREMPYMTFTGNVVKSISNLIEDGTLVGISNVIDATCDNPEICIQLTKGANVNKILRLLYKNTSLQNSFGINMNMLENGITPKLYTWKEQVQTYIDFLREITVKSYQYDLTKLLDRLHILKGLIIAQNNIDKVIDIIRKAPNKEIAKQLLISNYELDEIQVEAILKMKLSDLTHLEVDKLISEYEDKEPKAKNIQNILSSEENIKKEMIKDIEALSEKYGDERRTQIINLKFESEDEDAEPIEEKQLLIHFTNLGNIYTQESTTLLASKRGGKGTKVKLLANEAIINTINDDNLGNILAFSNKGQMYYTNTDNLPIGQRINVKQLFELESDEDITAITTFRNKNNFKYFVFITKQGMIKKTESLEYCIKRGNKLKAINLNDNDEVVSVHFVNEENIGILTKGNNFVNIETSNITAIGKNSKGVKAIKLNLNDEVISSKKINSESKYIIAVSKNGLIKKSNIEDFPVCSRDTKGKKISGTRDNDTIIDFLVLSNDNEVILSSKKQIIKINTIDLSVLSREATGVKAIDLKENDFVKGLTL